MTKLWKACASLACGVLTLGGIFTSAYFINRATTKGKEPALKYIDALPLANIAVDIDNFYFSDAVFLTAHNAFASKAEDYVFNAQQTRGVYEQLTKYSVRSIELDTYLVNNEVRVCHTQCGGNEMSVMRLGSDSNGVPLVKELESVYKFITLEGCGNGDRYFNFYFTPTSYTQAYTRVNITRALAYEFFRRPPIITIFFEDYTSVGGDGSILDSAIEQSGLSKYAITSDYTSKSISRFLLEDKRVIFFSSSFKNISKSKYIFNHWENIRESELDDTLFTGDSKHIEKLNADKVCSRLRGGGYSSDLRELLVLQYHPSLSIDADYNKINNASTVSELLLKCIQNNWGLPIGEPVRKYPNYIFADMIEKGDIYEVVMKNITNIRLLK